MTDVSAVQRLTGERTLPHIWHENYWFRRHEVVYGFLTTRLPDGARVLDAGCGEGYGSDLLRAHARSVTGIDYDPATLAHLAATYPEVSALRGNLVALPVADGACDAVVSLQVVEHVWEQPRYVAECARVLRPGGLLALSTPNRLTFSPGVGRGEKPLNPFHVNELDAEELVDLVTAEGLELTDMLGLRHDERIATWEALHGSLVTAQLAEPYTSWPDSLAEVVRSLGIDDFELTSKELETCLDLVVLARRRGEGG